MQKEPQEKIKVVLAEDHKTVRKLVKLFLEQDGRFEVVGEPGEGLEAVDAVERLQPDVLVVDIRLPGISGIEVAKRINRHFPTTKVIVMSMHSSDAHIYEALAAGARGYVVKSAIKDLPEAITEVNNGAVYLTPPLSMHRIERYRRDTNKPPLEILK